MSSDSSIWSSLFPSIFDNGGRKAIIEHKYVPGVKSITMPYLNYWWEYIVEFVPQTVAPNVLTLTTWIITWIAFYIYCYCDPTLTGQYSSFALFIYLSLTMFVYDTLDAIDGKHARRTSNSSPLGQLFDHGCDAMLVTPLFVMHSAIMGIGTNWQALYVLIMSQWVFYALNWRARHTGQFDFGSFSVDELFLIGIFVDFVTAFTGPQFWKNYPIPNALMVILSLAVFYNMNKAYSNVRKYYFVNKEKHPFYEERFYELGNLLIFHFCICVWNLDSIYTNYPKTFIITMSLVFSHLCHRLIICDVSQMKSRKCQYIIVPFIVIAACTVINRITFLGIEMDDPIVVYFAFCYSVWVTWNYIIRCMLEISSILNIKIFMINAPKIRSA